MQAQSAQGMSNSVPARSPKREAALSSSFHARSPKIVSRDITRSPSPSSFVVAAGGNPLPKSRPPARARSPVSIWSPPNSVQRMKTVGTNSQQSIVGTNGYLSTAHGQVVGPPQQESSTRSHDSIYQLMHNKEQLRHVAERAFRSGPGQPVDFERRLSFEEFRVTLSETLHSLGIALPSEDKFAAIFAEHGHNSMGVALTDFEALLFRFLSFLRASKEVGPAHRQQPGGHRTASINAMRSVPRQFVCVSPPGVLRQQSLRTPTSGYPSFVAPSPGSPPQLVAHARPTTGGISNPCEPHGATVKPCEPRTAGRLTGTALVILDWDDTLYPNSAERLMGGNDFNEKSKGHMPVLASLATQVIEAADKLGEVAIITCASKRHVLKCALRYGDSFHNYAKKMIAIGRLISARNSNITEASAMKELAFGKYLNKAVKRGKRFDVVLSIGDSMSDVSAVHSLPVHSVAWKLIDTPSLDNLRDELQRVLALLRDTFYESSRFDDELRLTLNAEESENSDTCTKISVMKIASVTIKSI